MRYLIALTAVALLVASMTIAEAPKQHTFMGTKKCVMCHKGKAKGEIFEKWQTTPHAKAYATLASQESKDLYAKLGKTGDPQKDPACLKCHVTGHGVPAAHTALLDVNEGVTCEACHGAGTDYGKMNIMKDKAASVAAGMVEKPEAGCVTCHNKQSPTYKEFVYADAWKLIEHKTPPAK